MASGGGGSGGFVGGGGGRALYTGAGNSTNKDHNILSAEQLVLDLSNPDLHETLS